jgi:hypothetical protein
MPICKENSCTSINRLIIYEMVSTSNSIIVSSLIRLKIDFIDKKMTAKYKVYAITLSNFNGITMTDLNRVIRPPCMVGNPKMKQINTWRY